MTIATITPSITVSAVLNSSNDQRFVAECECGWASRQLLAAETAVAAGERHVATQAHAAAIEEMHNPTACIHGVATDAVCDECAGALTEDVERVEEIIETPAAVATDSVEEVEVAPQPKVRQRMSVYLSDADLDMILSALVTVEPDMSAELIEKLEAAKTRRAMKRAAAAS